MAKAVAECKCKECGKVFEVTQICRNCQQANEWRKWAERSFVRCPGCDRKAMLEHGRELASKYSLPEISGTSEKQVSYALDLRAQYLAEHEDRVQEVLKMLDEIHSPENIEKFSATVEASGLPEPEYLRERFTKKILWYKCAYLVLMESDARVLIDALTDQ